MNHWVNNCLYKVYLYCSLTFLIERRCVYIITDKLKLSKIMMFLYIMDLHFDTCYYITYFATKDLSISCIFILNRTFALN